MHFICNITFDLGCSGGLQWLCGRFIMWILLQVSIVSCFHKLKLCWKVPVWSGNIIDLSWIMIVNNNIHFYGRLCLFFFAFVKVFLRYSIRTDVGVNYTLYRDLNIWVLVFQKLRYWFHSNQNRRPFVRVLSRDVWVYLSVL